MTSTRFVADSLFALHLLVVVIVLFGWLLPSTWYLYVVTLIGTLISDMIYGHCILSKWEFDLRKKINPDLTYNFAWTTYYTYKITNAHIADRFYRVAGMVFLIASLVINLYFRFV